ncbi:MAG: response regulator transcription factor [Pedobacter sp.]|nr:MAG: response regulator transcription factor [Pedobacter sp.]
MKSQLTCIVVDDNQLDRLSVENELSTFKNIQILGSFDSALAAVHFLTTRKPDVLFLDIDMPEINGIDLVKRLGSLDTVNVFITSHPEFALQGFQLKVFDFILKPLESDRFNQCIDRINDFIALKGKAEAYDVLFENEKIIFKEGHNIVNLSTSEVIYLEAYGDYTKIVTEKKSHLTLTTLGSFLESLPTGRFFRIHRSYVVPTNVIASCATKSLTLNNGVVLPIGKTYLKEAKQVFR